MNSRLRSLFLVPLLACGLLLGLAGSAAAAPANDNFAARQTISGALPLTVAASNIGATAEIGEPMTAGNNPQRSIWFSWTAPNANKVVLDFCAVELPTSSQPNPLMAARTGTTLGSLVSVNQSSGRCAMRLNPVSGTTYNFQVDFGNNEGNFNLLLRPLSPPANDSFATPVVLGPSLPLSQNGTTIDSNWEAGEPSFLGGSSSSRSVWYSWTAPASGRIRVEQCDTTYYDGPLNRQVFVYTGSTIGTLVAVSSMTSNDCAQDLSVVAGVTYRIAVSGDIKGEFDFVLRMKNAPPPTNDNFATPQVIGPGLPIQLNGDNDFATKEGGEPDHGGYSPTSRSVWYSWTAGQSGPVRIRTCGKGLQHFSSVYTGNSLASLTEVGERFYYAPCSNFVEAVAGTTYRIAVAGGPIQSWHGPFVLDVHQVVVPGNDAFDSAVDLGSGLDVTRQGSTVDSTTEEFEPDHSGDNGSDGGSVWYRWTAPNDNAAILSACSTGEPNRIAVYANDPEREETGIRDLQQLDNDEIACRDGQNGGRLAIAPVKGTTYFIAVQPSVDDYESAFTLNIKGTAEAVVPKPTPFNLNKAIAKCKKIKGTSKKAKRKRANCIKAARKKAAIIKCRKIANGKKQVACIKKARKRFS